MKTKYELLSGILGTDIDHRQDCANLPPIYVSRKTIDNVETTLL